MIPLRDDVASHRIPFINGLMIGLCAVVFLLQMSQADPTGSPGLTAEYGMVPFRISHPGEAFKIPEIQLIETNRGPQYGVVEAPAPPAGVSPLLTMLTCIFLHGGWMHFIGNMWFLWIFGDNVEDRLGHIGYAVFYIVSGLAASVTHYLTDPASTIPTIGASGAIAGVMGAYFVWYPHSRVHSLVPFFGFLQFVEIPAPFFLGIWFLMQLLQGGATGGGEGVAWWAHIGGFAFGAVIAFLLGKSGLLTPLRGHRDAPHLRRGTYES
jgi:membrane associated rhomboid family serine protease